MRNVISWICSIAVFVLLTTLSILLIEYMDMEVAKDILGAFTLIISGMIAYRIGILIQQKELSEEKLIVFNCWILGLVLITVLTGLIFKAFDDVYSTIGTNFKVALFVAAIAGTIWVTKQVYKQKKAQHEKELKQYFEESNNK